MSGETRAAILLEDLQDLFAVAEAVEQRCQRADVERMRAQPHLVACQAVQLGQDHADVPGALRRFHAQQLFHRLAVTQPVGNGGDVIHAVNVRIELHVGAVLGDLLDAAMQVPYNTVGAQNLFAVKLEDDSQHAVG